MTSHNRSRNHWPKTILILLLAIVFFLIKFYDLQQYFTLDFIKSHLHSLQSTYQEHKVKTLLAYGAFYILITALSLPGAIILTLLAGALFGLIPGLIIVSFASSIGATLAFLMARFLLRDYLQERFQQQLQSLNKGIEKDGAFYLFTLRLVPLFPFFVVNILMGLTTLKTKTFFFVGQLGMLLGTALYVNAGENLVQLDSIQGLLSAKILSSMALLGLLPLISKKIVNILRNQRLYQHYPKPTSFDYNMVVIGGGPAGLVTSYLSAALKAKVALIEKDAMGGDCLNTGCVPSKAFLSSAKIVHLQHRAKNFGLRSLRPDFDFAEIMERVQKVIKKIGPHDSVERYTGLGVECIQGKAEILSPFEVRVNGKILTTKNITLATGATPIIPPIPGLQQISYLTSENVWKLRTLPKRLIVIGGGPIGLELAQGFARFGSKVQIIQQAPRILMKEDPEVSLLMHKTLESEGIKIHVGTRALEIVSSKSEKGDKILLCESSNSSHFQKNLEIPFDEILLAVGRKANTTHLGAEKLGLALRSDGTLETNDFLQTKYPNIFACGDVTGPYQFTHTASHQAWYCAVNGLFSNFKAFPVDYRVIPWCTFTDPEIAKVGFNEEEAKTQGIPYEIVTYSLEDLDRAITEEEDHGFIKVLTVPGKDKILGATIVGPRAGELIIEFVSAIKQGIGLNKILETIHIYPTFGEANRYLAGVWRKSRTSPRTFSFLKKFHAWQRNGFFNYFISQ